MDRYPPLRWGSGPGLVDQAALRDRHGREGAQHRVEGVGALLHRMLEAAEVEARLQAAQNGPPDVGTLDGVAVPLVRQTPGPELGRGKRLDKERGRGPRKWPDRSADQVEEGEAGSHRRSATRLPP